MIPYHRQDDHTVEDGNAIAVAEDGGQGLYEARRSHTQSEFGDSLYSAVSTKPVGSGGEKKRSGNSRKEKEEGIIFSSYALLLV